MLSETSRLISFFVKIFAHWTRHLKLLEMGIGRNIGEASACAMREIFTASLLWWGTSLFSVIINLSVTIPVNSQD